MEPDVDALATQQDVVDLSRPMVLGGSPATVGTC
jgi:hypothetical protein